MALFSDMMDEAGDLRDEIERLRAGIQSYIDGNYGRDQYFKTKHDQCPHGRFGWEPCDNCIDDHFSKLIGLPLAQA